MERRAGRSAVLGHSIRTARAQHPGCCKASSHQTPTATVLSLEVLKMNAGTQAQENAWAPGTARTVPAQSLSPVAWSPSFASGAPLFSFRKGGEIGRTEVSCPFIGSSVQVPFEKLPRGLTEPQERWDFPHVDRWQGSAHWEGGWGEGRVSKE